MSKRAVTVELTTAERSAPEDLARGRRTAQGLARHARIVLAAATGKENKAIAKELEADEKTVGKWRRRFAAPRLDGMYDEPRSGAPRRIGDDAIAETIRLTLETTPAGATHWSLRSMANAVNHAPSTIQASTARNRSCRCAPAKSNGAATIMRGTAPCRCLPLWTPLPAMSSANALPGIAPESSVPS